MKNLLCKRGLVFIVSLFLMLSCSKNESPEESNVEAKEIFLSQAVTIELLNENLSQNEYQGEIDGTSVTLIKSAENKLLFLVPSTVKIGLKNLNIPALNNTTIHYNVKETLLTESSEGTLSDFFSHLNTFSATLSSSTDDLALKKEIEDFNTFYAKSDNEAKINFAKMYKANKASIDDVFLNNSMRTSKMALSEKDEAIFKNFSLSVIAMSMGVVIMWDSYKMAITNPTFALLATAGGAVLAKVGFTKGKKYGLQLLESDLLTNSLQVDNYFGVNNKRATNYSLTSDVEKVSTFNLGERKIISSDESNSNNSLLSTFFKSYNVTNSFVEKINAVIDWVVNNAYFVNYKKVVKLQAANTSSTVYSNIDAETFKNIKFSVSDPNLSLVSTSLQDKGQLILKIKITGTPSSLPVKSYLNYTYSDALSSFIGKLPIEVNDVAPGEWFEGTYTLDHWGESPQTNYSYNCGSQYGQKEKIFFYKTSDKVVCYAKSIIADFPDFLVANVYDEDHKNYFRRWINPNSDNGLGYTNWEIYVSLVDNSYSGNGYAAIELQPGDPEVCDAYNNVNYKYFYDVVISAQNVGSEPPASLSSAEVKKIIDLPVSMQP